MSDVKFVLGASAEIASSDDVRSAVKAGTDTILGTLGQSRHRGIRRRIPSSVSNAAVATGTWVLDFGSPSGGSIWWLVEVAVVGSDDRTAVAGAFATLYSGAPARQATGSTVLDTPSLGAMIRPGIAIPGVFTFSKESFPIHDGENLFSVVYSPTTPVLFVAGVATVMEVQSSLVSLNRM